MKYLSGNRDEMPELLNGGEIYDCLDTRELYMGTSRGNLKLPFPAGEWVKFVPKHRDGNPPILSIIDTNSSRKFGIIHVATGRYTIYWDGPMVRTVEFITSSNNNAFMKIEADACNMHYESGFVTALDFDSFNASGAKNLEDSTSEIVCTLYLYTKLSY